jgi:hypothetical protein
MRTIAHVIHFGKQLANRLGFDVRRIGPQQPSRLPVKTARSTPRPSFGLPELLVASHISRLAFRDAAKSLLSTLV